MLDMGFRPQVDRILSQVPKNRQTMLFSATLDGPVADLAASYTSSASRFRSGARAEAQTGQVEHEFVPVTAESKLHQLVEQLKRERGRTLVFVRTKHGADKLARKLARDHDVRAAVHAREHVPERPRAVAVAVRVGPGLDHDRDRRGGPRAARRRHHARHQLRPAAHRRRLRPPRRAHRPRRASPAPESPSYCPSSARTSGSSRRGSDTARPSRPPACASRRRQRERNRPAAGEPEATASFAALCALTADELHG